MFNPYSNNCCRVSNSVLVDRAFGESYHIVKEVYNNLDILKDITIDESLDFIVDNYDELMAVKPYMIQVIENIKDINITAGNINSIITVSSDLKGEILSDMSNDLGMIGEDEEGDNTVITGGNIKKVADDIESVRTNANNIEDIILVADNIENLPNIQANLGAILDESQEVNSITKSYLDEANSAISTIRDEVPKIINEGTKQVNLVIAEGNTQINDIKTASATNIIQAENQAITNIKKQEETIKTNLQKYSDQAEDLYNKVNEVNENFNANYDQVENIIDDLEAINKNLDNVILVGKHIGNVSLVGADLQGTFEVDTIIDYGNLDIPGSGSAVITGGNIYTVSQNIQSVNTVSTNINSVIKVADNIDTITGIESNVIEAGEQAIKDIQNEANTQLGVITAQVVIAEEASLSASNSASLANQYKTETESLKTETNSILEEVKLEGPKQITLIQQASADKIISAENSALESIQTSLDETKLSITNSTNSEIERVKAQGTTSINELTATQSTVISAIKYQETTSIGNIKSSESTIIDNITNETSNQVDLVTAEGIKQISAISTAKDQVLSEIQPKVEEATTQANRAYSEAERAKEYADNASKGQVNSDWNETDSSSKAFIKNKPDIYTKSEVDSKLTAVYVYKGTVNTIEELPSSEVKVGWTYNVKKTGANYSWDGSAWDELGATIDLSPYATISFVNSGLESKLGKSDKAVSASVADNVAWTGITGTPSTFTPSQHTHEISEVNGLQSALDGKQVVGDYATNTALTNGLASKQPLGNYLTTESNIDYSKLINIPSYIDYGTL